MHWLFIAEKHGTIFAFDDGEILCRGDFQRISAPFSLKTSDCLTKRLTWKIHTLLNNIKIQHIEVNKIPTNAIYSGVCYNEQMLQRTVFINKVRMLQRTKMLQRKRRNTIGRRSTRVRMMCRAFPL